MRYFNIAFAVVCLFGSMASIAQAEGEAASRHDKLSATQPTQPTTQPSTQPATQPATAPSASAQFIERVESAHGAGVWRDHEAFQFDCIVEFQGAEMVNGTFLISIHEWKARLDQGDNVDVIFNNGDCWLAPSDSDYSGGRFHVLTWPWFLTEPFTLGGSQTQLRLLGEDSLDGKSFATALQTFGENAGDAPDDWYIHYFDEESHQLMASAYIVTFGKAKGKAEEEPHVVLFEDFVDVDGVVLPTDWTFFNWSREEGKFGDPIGRVNVSNMKFVDPAPGAFEKPDDARTLEVPGVK